MGLMGGSLALALRGRCLEILGIDPDPAALELALERGAADRVSVHPGDLLPEADIIVLAAPVLAILRLLEALPNLHPGRSGGARPGLDQARYRARDGAVTGAL
jgi:prephenate dehydrogenase